MSVTKADITKKCIEDFKKYGWKIGEENCAINAGDETVEVDFALIGESHSNLDVISYDAEFFQVDFDLKTESICGYVLVIYPENKEDIVKIRGKLQSLLSVVKPKVLFVTDGNVYEAYFYGNYYDTLMVPIKARNIDQSIRLLTYLKKIRELREEA